MSSGSLGSLVVRLALQAAGYKADLNENAAETERVATRIEGAAGRVRNAGRTMDGALGDSAETAATAARALGIVGATAAAVAVSIGGTAYAAYKGAQEQRAFQQAIILTGNVSGTTASQMQSMAAGIDNVVGTHYQAAAALTAMASTGQIAGVNLQGFAQVAIETERVVGTSVGDTAKVFETLGEAPVKASIKLNESMNYLTAATFEQIKAADELGDHEKAASLAQEAYASAMHGRTEQIKGNLGTLEKAWMGVRDFAKEAWDSMLGLGRQADPSKQLDTLSKQIADKRAQLADKGLTANFGGTEKLQAELNVLVAQQGVVQETVRLGKIGAQHQAESAAQEKAKIAWMQEGDRYLSKEEKLEGAIAAIRFKGAQAGADELEIQKRINFEREKAADKPKKDNSTQRELEREAALLATLSGVNADYQEQLGRLQRLRDKGNISEEQYIQLLNQLIAKQPMAKALMDESVKAFDREQKATLAAGAAHWKYIESLNKGLTTLQDENQKLEEHNARLGLSKTAIAELDAAKLEDQAITLELLAIKELDKNLDEAQYELLKKKSAEYRRQAQLKKEGAIKEEAIDAANESAKAWQSGWESTNRVAHDSFVMWTEDGADAAKKIGQVLEKSIASALYKSFAEPLVLNVFTSVVGGKPSAAGGVVNAAAGGNGGGILGSFMGPGTALGTFGSGFNAGLGAVFGEAGTLGGLSAGTTALGAGNIMGGLGTLAGTAMPWIAGAMILKSVMDYKVTPNGGAIVANVGSGGASAVANRSDFIQEGGFLGGGRTKNASWADADAGTTGYIDQSVKNITASNKAYAEAIGLNADAMDGFTKQIEINTSGMDQAAAQAAIDAELTKFSADQVSASYGEALKGVAREGETSAQTLERLATDLTGANAVMDLLGYTLFDVGTAGAAAASGLVQAMGGMAAFQSQMASYYQSFYTAEEQRANTIEAAQGVLSGAGLDFTAEQIGGASRADIRAVVDQLAKDKGTDEGAKRYAAAIKAANLLTGVTPSLDSAKTPTVEHVGSSGGGGGGGGGSASDTALSEWERATQAIVDTMKDLRTTLIDTGPQSLAQMEAQLAIEVAQAQAGSLQAMQDLPELAKALSQTYAQQNRSSVDQAVFNARLVETLGRVAGVSTGAPTISLPSFDVGTDYVPQDMIALIHAGERITPKPFNPTLAESSRSAGSAGANEDLVKLAREVLTALGLIASNTGGTKDQAKLTADVLTNATRGGAPVRTKAVV